MSVLLFVCILLFVSGRPASLSEIFPNSQNEALTTQGVHNLLFYFFSKVEQKLDQLTVNVRDIQVKVDKLEIATMSLLNFGDGSPHNATANQVAKEFLATFVFFPTKTAIIKAGVAVFAGFLDPQKNKDLFVKYVGIFHSLF